MVAVEPMVASGDLTLKVHRFAEDHNQKIRIAFRMGKRGRVQ